MVFSGKGRGYDLVVGNLQFSVIIACYLVKVLK